MTLADAIGPNAHAYLFEPIVALTVVAGLAVLLRWAFAHGGSLVERTPHPGHSDDYGLLVPVAAPGDQTEGEVVRRRLEEHGVRAILTTTVDGPRVMVFPGDEERAHRLVG